MSIDHEFVGLRQWGIDPSADKPCQHPGCGAIAERLPTPTPQPPSYECPRCHEPYADQLGVACQNCAWGDDGEDRFRDECAPVQVDTEQPACIDWGGCADSGGCEGRCATEPSPGRPSPAEVLSLGPGERGRRWRDREGTEWSSTDGTWLAVYPNGSYLGGLRSVPTDLGPFVEVPGEV